MPSTILPAVIGVAPELTVATPMAALGPIVWAAAGNRYLDRSLRQIEQAVRRFRHTTFELPGRPSESVEEHARIARAIAERDAPDAERLAKEHMRHLSELRVRMLLEGY